MKQKKSSLLNRLGKFAPQYRKTELFGTSALTLGFGTALYAYEQHGEALSVESESNTEVKHPAMASMATKISTHMPYVAIQLADAGGKVALQPAMPAAGPDANEVVPQESSEKPLLSGGTSQALLEPSEQPSVAAQVESNIYHLNTEMTDNDPLLGAGIVAQEKTEQTFSSSAKIVLEETVSSNAAAQATTYNAEAPVVVLVTEKTEEATVEIQENTTKSESQQAPAPAIPAQTVTEPATEEAEATDDSVHVVARDAAMTVSDFQQGQDKLDVSALVGTNATVAFVDKSQLNVDFGQFTEQFFEAALWNSFENKPEYLDEIEDLVAQLSDIHTIDENMDIDRIDLFLEQATAKLVAGFSTGGGAAGGGGGGGGGSDDEYNEDDDGDDDADTHHLDDGDDDTDVTETEVRHLFDDAFDTIKAAVDYYKSKQAEMTASDLVIAFEQEEGGLLLSFHQGHSDSLKEMPELANVTLTAFQHTITNDDIIL